MTYLLGIDYGSKYVGISGAQSEAGISVPIEVIPNDKNLLNRVMDLVIGREVEVIVLGNSINNRGEENKIMEEIRVFEKNLLKKIEAHNLSRSISLHYEDERYTSFAAKRLLDKNTRADSSAAALILQSWIDKRKD